MVTESILGETHRGCGERRRKGNQTEVGEGGDVKNTRGPRGHNRSRTVEISPAFVNLQKKKNNLDSKQAKKKNKDIDNKKKGRGEKDWGLLPYGRKEGKGW